MNINDIYAQVFKIIVEVNNTGHYHLHRIQSGSRHLSNHRIHRSLLLHSPVLRR